ncbi:hypothetical protein C1708_06320 [Streptomyces sp. DH-12]|uniref:GntR family transcriptional regulator n=1 Tax=unclassified Streptomyces TaxID=2593676 RepID=UPI000CCE0DC4|nr:GntR family transcriptional regulator [Streptomyces sp. DH-12]PNV31964.1 hypothetical protein C1708_06320 [Streptomyces sp. DH-12]
MTAPRAHGPTPLTRRTAARIVEYSASSDMPVGARLVERALAEQLKVSRSPVRRALHLLGTMEWWPPPNGAAAPSLSPVRP